MRTQSLLGVGRIGERSLLVPDNKKTMSWKAAIEKVLEASATPMNCSDIALEVGKKKYRSADALGATPANTVSTVINVSLKNDGEQSPFFRADRGLYYLKMAGSLPSETEEDVNEAVSSVTGIINALGMFWERSKVLWKTEPRLLGQQQTGAKSVDFCKEIGVYLLHDAQGVVYVGRAIDQPMGRRLQQHTTDRLSGRWDRFSWFGMYPVEDSGDLKVTADISNVGVSIVIATLEAVLIEGLEPRQNRRRGDDFQAVEFLQVEDPTIEQNRQKSILAQLAAQLGGKTS